MNRSRICSLVGAILFTISISGVQAQTAPPLKPGLWEIHMEHMVNGQKIPDMSEHMKNMTPEMRAQVEAMMKKRGMAMDAGGGISKVCYSRESIDQHRWADVKTGCKTDFSTQTATSWKWHSSCPQYHSESDGEATFNGSENYVMKMSSVTKDEGPERTSQTTITGKFLSADCGDIQPIMVK
jgi:hypothetical protein